MGPNSISVGNDQNWVRDLYLGEWSKSGLITKSQINYGETDDMHLLLLNKKSFPLSFSKFEQIHSKKQRSNEVSVKKS